MTTNLFGLINQQPTYMSVAGLEIITPGSAAKRLTLSHHTSKNPICRCMSNTKFGAEYQSVLNGSKTMNDVPPSWSAKINVQFSYKLLSYKKHHFRSSMETQFLLVRHVILNKTKLDESPVCVIYVSTLISYFKPNFLDTPWAYFYYL